MTDQINNIFSIFFKCKVKYIVIGGFAVNLYGYTRNTGDLDIYIDDSIQNRKNLREAFIEIGIGDFEALETMQFVAGWTEFNLDYGMRLDLMTNIKGLEDKPFDKLLDVATIVFLNEIPVYFIDFKNLIISKKAANRLKDILDIEELNKLNDENQ
jgi:hypothetical protein